MEKTVKARKDHKCDICDGAIKKGELYDYQEMKVPNYDSDDMQIGIHFHKWRTHPLEQECFKCKDKPCQYTYYPAVCFQGGYQEPMYYCENCGHTK